MVEKMPASAAPMPTKMNVVDPDALDVDAHLMRAVRIVADAFTCGAETGAGCRGARRKTTKASAQKICTGTPDTIELEKIV